ncbi:hypothetical protein TUM20983_38310 [Mycobacterium antarcticum]|uniref:hypothetical protein n=1 Tax=unclassified Mycolicibacterium TaxID=2636767 RepID=UPI00239D818C|nr:MULTISPECIES: hypothetical protein [unclassified Mycolicibacterium]GLP76721.1 hypothetical protein TUM20983_38310 [Mycolicibacterium sp. TUM20983]GLP82842.1 hypothetical protein TUM20984_42620 [Mycolicibacterium sp. TUM20984]
MDSPRSGFRRAAAASWALMGLGVAGVAGASALAYVDTVKPPVATAAVESAPPQVIPPLISPPLVEPPPVPDVSTTTVEPAPEPQYTPVPEYTPVPQYTTQAPAPRASTPPTTKRRLAPTTVMAPNYSPQITVSRGS